MRRKSPTASTTTTSCPWVSVITLRSPTLGPARTTAPSRLADPRNCRLPIGESPAVAASCSCGAAPARVAVSSSTARPTRAHATSAPGLGRRWNRRTATSGEAGGRGAMWGRREVGCTLHLRVRMRPVGVGGWAGASGGPGSDCHAAPPIRTPPAARGWRRSLALRPAIVKRCRHAPRIFCAPTVRHAPGHGCQNDRRGGPYLSRRAYVAGAAPAGASRWPVNPAHPLL